MSRRIRRREVPTRTFGDRVIVARPADGAPVVLAATAALVWDELGAWKTVDGLEARLATAFPEVPERERRQALGEILGAFEVDDLIART
jgi:hypothetical protein